MNKNNPLLLSFGHALLVLIYTSAVAWVMFHASTLFGKADGKADTFLAPVAMLLLFVLSATIVGSLVIGRPVLMYLDGKKKEALQFLGYTIFWLFVLTIIVFIKLAVFT